jgi:hypothetical protein
MTKQGSFRFGKNGYRAITNDISSHLAILADKKFRFVCQQDPTAPFRLLT